MKSRLFFFLIFVFFLTAPSVVAAQIVNYIELQHAENYEIGDGFYLISSSQSNPMLGSDLSEYGVDRYYWQYSNDGVNFSLYATTSGPNLEFVYARLGYSYYFRRMVYDGDGNELYSNVLKFKCTKEKSTAYVCQYQPFSLGFNGPTYDFYQWYKDGVRVPGANSTVLRVTSGMETSAEFYIECRNIKETSVFRSYYQINTKDMQPLEPIQEQYVLLPGEDSHVWSFSGGDIVTLRPGEYYSYTSSMTMRYPNCLYRNTILSVIHNSQAEFPDYTVYYSGSVVGQDIFGSVTDESGNDISRQGKMQYFIFSDERDAFVPISENSDPLLPGKYKMYLIFEPSNPSIYPPAESGVADILVKQKISVEANDEVIYYGEFPTENARLEVGGEPVSGIAGDFSYLIDGENFAGKLLDVGVYTVDVDFLPQSHEIYEVSATTKKITVLPLPLKVDYEITKSKIYDGTSFCEIHGVGVSGFLDKDAESVKVSASANYIDPKVGFGKHVDIVYDWHESDAEALKNYTYPLTAIDKADIILPDFFVKFTSDYNVYCTGDFMDLDYEVEYGEASEYKLEFSENCDLAPVGWTALPAGKLKYLVNDYKNFGSDFSAVFTVRDNYGREFSHELKFGLNIPNYYVHSKYHDVVFVDNHEDLYVEYQWFKNGEIQPGKTGQFWQDTSGDNQGLEGWYMAQVLTIYGERLMTCPVFYDNLRISNHFFAYAFPNPVLQNSEVSIELKDITDEQLKIAKIYIYQNSGKLAQVLQQVERLNVTTLPYGEYVAKVVVGKQVQTLKIIVR